MYYIPLIFSLQHLKMRFYWASTMDFWIRDFVSSLRSLAEIKVTYLNSFKLSNVTVHFLLNTQCFLSPGQEIKNPEMHIVISCIFASLDRVD